MNPPESWPAELDNRHGRKPFARRFSQNTFLELVRVAEGNESSRVYIKVLTRVSQLEALRII